MGPGCAGSFSTGMKVRLSLAMALLTDGGIVLCLIMDAMLLRLPETES